MKSNGVSSPWRAVGRSAKVAAWLLPLAAVASAHGAGDDPTLKIESGAIRGFTVQSATPGGVEVRAFLGIPFAAPPVGPLRWRAPEPPSSWQDVRACDHFGASCPQPPTPMNTAGGGAGVQSEDCLDLNVWTAAPKADAKWPVMVWIHGGGFFLGSASGTSYDGANLARKQVVVVTINYRLGPFGFLGHPELSKETPNGATCNWGLLDQIAALKWVQRNIAAFGGDPGNVTIFGESAGAMSVSCLLLSPLAKGLFQRAIAESGPAMWLERHLKTAWRNEESCEAQGERILRSLVGETKDVLAAARGKSAAEVLAAAKPTLRLAADEEGNTFRPVIDGYVIPDEPEKLFAEGKVNLVPFLTGTNADEGTIFTPQGSSVTLEQQKAYLTINYGDDAKKLIDYYSLERFHDTGRSGAEMFADLVFIAPTRAQIRALADAGAHCFLYHFTRVRGGRERNPLGAYHSAEIAYVFGNTENSLLARYAEVDRKLSSTMMEAWVQFARTGNPNREGLPKWPEYTPEEDPYLDFGDEIKPGNDLHKEACDVWDGIVEGWRAQAQH